MHRSINNWGHKRKTFYMKKIYSFFVLSCLSTTFVSAQFKKGQKVLGGNIEFSTGTLKNYP